MSLHLFFSFSSGKNPELIRKKNDGKYIWYQYAFFVANEPGQVIMEYAPREHTTEI